MGHTPAEILGYANTVAVVGASSDPEKKASSVPTRLMRRGFKVIPVNPTKAEVLGLTAYPDLASIPEKVDVVQVFRPPEEAPDIARQAVAIGARALWLQEELKSDGARQIAEAGGLDYVEDRCMAAESDLIGITKVPA
jgi:predicted CoA-binding protein